MALQKLTLCLLALLASTSTTSTTAQTTTTTMTTAAAAASKPPLLAQALQNSTRSTNASASTASTLTFKILQLADLHFSGDPTYPCRDAPSGQSSCTEALMSTFIDELLDAEKPDLVVFTGDNVQTFAQQDQQRAVDAFTRGVEQRQIPFAVVLGNHDDENGFPREDVLRRTMAKRMSYTQRGPLDVDGVGNYMLSVRAPVSGAWGNASDAVLRLYFLDSGGYPDKTKYPNVDSTYDWIKDSQVEYYRNLSLQAQATQATSLRPNTTTATTSSAGAPPLPALMFFHIPLREYEYSAMDWQRKNGEANERVHASDVHSKLFDTLIERDEVKATFVGHDHTNEYCYHRDGIQLCYGGGAGFGVSYGASTFARRARVIEWSVNSNNKRSIRSWKRLFGCPNNAKYEVEELYSECQQASVGMATSYDDDIDASDTSSAVVLNSAAGWSVALVSLLVGVLLELL